MVREIKGFSGPEPGAEEEAEEPRVDERPERPQPLARRVVASRHGVETFGELLVSEAYHRRFAAAPHKAFVADGSEANCRLPCLQQMVDAESSLEKCRELRS